MLHLSVPVSSNPVLSCRSVACRNVRHLSRNSKRFYCQKTPNDLQKEALSDRWRWEESLDSLSTHGMLLSVLLCGSQSFFYNFTYSQIPYFTLVAGLSVYIGAHRSLHAPPEQSISSKQSLVAPIIASVSLFGMYCIIKHFPGFKLQSLLDLLLVFIGSTALFQFVFPYLRRVSWMEDRTWQVPSWLQEDSNIDQLSGAKMIGWGVSLLVVLLDIFSGHQNFTLNNFLACCIAIHIIQSVGIKSFKSASILLLGLLCYDVLWVFLSQDLIGESVMQTVTTSDALNGPLKFLIPHGIAQASFPYSVLGLGDVALPGILAALFLRFDISRKEFEDKEGYAYAFESTPTEEAFFKSRVYFLPVMASYIGGLMLTFGANIFTNSGQPALLYIVPCMLLTSVAISISRKEFHKLINHQNQGVQALLRDSNLDPKQTSEGK